MLFRSSQIQEGIDSQGQLSQNAKDAVNRQLRSHFRPEFLNRIDDIVMFTPLSKEQVRKIVDLLLSRLKNRLKEKQLSIRLTEAALDRMMEMGYDPVYGARPMKRLLQSKVETLVARRLIAGDVLPGQTIVIDAGEQEDFTAAVQ